MSCPPLSSGRNLYSYIMNGSKGSRRCRRNRCKSVGSRRGEAFGQNACLQNIHTMPNASPSSPATLSRYGSRRGCRGAAEMFEHTGSVITTLRPFWEDTFEFTSRTSAVGALRAEMFEHTGSIITTLRPFSEGTFEFRPCGRAQLLDPRTEGDSNVPAAPLRLLNRQRAAGNGYVTMEQFPSPHRSMTRSLAFDCTCFGTLVKKQK
jgi:hypothetical protein